MRAAFGGGLDPGRPFAARAGVSPDATARLTASVCRKGGVASLPAANALDEHQTVALGERAHRGETRRLHVGHAVARPRGAATEPGAEPGRRTSSDDHRPAAR